MCTDASSGIIISQVKPAVLLKTPTIPGQSLLEIF